MPPPDAAPSPKTDETLRLGRPYSPHSETATANTFTSEKRHRSGADSGTAPVRAAGSLRRPRRAPPTRTSSARRRGAHHLVEREDHARSLRARDLPVRELRSAHVRDASRGRAAQARQHAGVVAGPGSLGDHAPGQADDPRRASGSLRAALSRRRVGSRRQARAVSERLVDLREILRGLHDREIDYVLFGATAMLFYGFVRNTDDVDIVVAGDEGNLRRVHDWLVSIDAHLRLNPGRPFGPRERWRMLRGANATVTTTCGQIDIVQQLEGLPPFERLASESEVFEREGMRVRVMHRQTLVELKSRRASSQDLADIEAIELLEQLE